MASNRRRPPIGAYALQALHYEFESVCHALKRLSVARDGGSMIGGQHIYGVDFNDAGYPFLPPGEAAARHGVGLRSPRERFGGGFQSGRFGSSLVLVELVRPHACYDWTRPGVRTHGLRSLDGASDPGIFHPRGLEHLGLGRGFLDSSVHGSRLGRLGARLRRRQ